MGPLAVSNAMRLLPRILLYTGGFRDVAFVFTWLPWELPALNTTVPSPRGRGPNVLTKGILPPELAGTTDGNNEDANPEEGEGVEETGGEKDDDGRGGWKDPLHCEGAVAILGTGTL